LASRGTGIDWNTNERKAEGMKQVTEAQSVTLVAAGGRREDGNEGRGSVKGKEENELAKSGDGRKRWEPFQARAGVLAPQGKCVKGVAIGRKASAQARKKDYGRQYRHTTNDLGPDDATVGRERCQDARRWSKGAGGTLSKETFDGNGEKGSQPRNALSG